MESPWVSWVMWNISGEWLKGEVVLFVRETGEAIGVISVAEWAFCWVPYVLDGEGIVRARINLHEFNNGTGRPLAELVSELGGGEVDVHGLRAASIASARV